MCVLSRAHKHMLKDTPDFLIYPSAGMCVCVNCVTIPVVGPEDRASLEDTLEENTAPLHCLQNISVDAARTKSDFILLKICSYLKTAYPHQALFCLFRFPLQGQSHVEIGNHKAWLSS